MRVHERRPDGSEIDIESRSIKAVQQAVNDWRMSFMSEEKSKADERVVGFVVNSTPNKQEDEGASIND